LNVTASLPAYFKRIGFSGIAGTNLETLRALIRCHTASIPFENLDVLLNRPIRLETDAIEQKFIQSHRGGYCFEQNGFLLHILLALGFKATALSARVRLNVARDSTPPRTHLFVRVMLEDVPWLCDVGVGGFSPTAPLQMDVQTEQFTPHEPRRIVREDGRYFHQVKLGTEWMDVCEFTLDEMPFIDRQLANYWTSTHPDSKFRNNLFAARAGENGTRYSILNSEFTHRKGSDILVQRELKTPAELLAHLADYFGLYFPSDTRFSVPGIG
jgi:N-hydroxyarylamine O-acetyltransferase